MKTFKITSIIPASRVEKFVVKANTPEEAYEEFMKNGGILISSETTLSREYTECEYPKEI